MLRVQINLQTSEDAKKLVDEERAFARAEIKDARAAVQREALQECLKLPENRFVIFTCHL